MHRNLRRALRLSVSAGLTLAIAMGVGGEAGATIGTGDSFTAIFTETSPTPGLAADATFILGAPSGSPGFFSIASFSAIGSGGTCLTCGLLTEVLTGVSFDSADLLLTGDITGSFLGTGGALHTFDLALTDPGATWIFTDDHVLGGFTTVSSGTYATIVTPIPEPSAVLAFATGLVALGLYNARRRRTRFRSC